MDIYDEIVRLRKLGQKCALATIVQVKGSIPSYESAKLLVREDGSFVKTERAVTRYNLTEWTSTTRSCGCAS